MRKRKEEYMCTNFRLTTTDGTIIIGRSMEYALDLDSHIRIFPKGAQRHSVAPGGTRGLEWTPQYGALGLDIGGFDYCVDGMNERGLTIHALYLPGYTGYQDAAAEREPDQALAHLDLPAWILGNFATVAEVQAALETVRVWGLVVDELKAVPPLHYAVHDAQGTSLVIEYEEGQLRVYDNPLGVLTNSPPFYWHLINLGNYLNVRAISTTPVRIADTVLAPPGQGGGFLGIPGDWTPPARFVRTVAMSQFAQPAQNAAEGVQLAAHLLNAVDIPKGDIREQPSDLDQTDYTEWATIWDLTNRVLFYRSYDNLTLRSIALGQLDLTRDGKQARVPVRGGTPAVDVTAALR
ncbi:MAG: choloylglycine hydrolase family protein [Pseudomonadota bacterium]|nr:choloylglycine hydrolase family protein [Pseudomonadota bacterium]